MVSGIVQEVTSFYYDDAMTTAKVTHDWMRELIKNRTKEWETIIQECIDSKHVFQAETKSFNNDSDSRFTDLFHSVLLLLAVSSFIF